MPHALGVTVDVRVGDVLAPDVPRRSFDVVASSLVLFFLPDALSALRSWRPLLDDGGRLGVTTFGPYTDEWRDEVKAPLRRFADGSIPNARTSGTHGPFASDEGMEDLLRHAGFGTVRTAFSTVSPRFEDPDDWYRWSMTIGLRRFWEAVPADQLPLVKAGVLAAADRCRDADGRIGFDQVVRYTVAT